MPFRYVGPLGALLIKRIFVARPVVSAFGIQLAKGQ